MPVMMRANCLPLPEKNAAPCLGRVGVKISRRTAGADFLRPHEEEALPANAAGPDGPLVPTPMGLLALPSEPDGFSPISFEFETADKRGRASAPGTGGSPWPPSMDARIMLRLWDGRRRRRNQALDFVMASPNGLFS